MSPFRKFVTFLSFVTIVSLTLTAKLDLPMHNENAVLQRIDMPNEFPKDILWDFSDCEITGDPIGVRFFRRGDSCISATLPGVRYDFEIKGDTILHTVTETHYQCLKDTVPLVYALPSPTFSYSGKFATRGRAYHSEYIDGFGEVVLSPVGHGAVILPSGDTIANVTLTHLTTRQFLASMLHARPHASAYSIDSLVQRTTDVYSWQSDQYPIPVIRYSLQSDSLAGQPLGYINVSSWMCCPADQPLQIRTRSFNRNNSKIIEDAYGFDNDSPLVSLLITSETGSVSVSGVVAKNGRISMILTDIVGRVYSTMPATEFRVGTSVEWSAEGLPAGQYVLYISHDDADPVAHKIIIH